MKITRVLLCLLGLMLGGILVMAATTGPSQATPPGKPAIYEFSRLLCPVCAKMEAILKEIQARYGDQLEVRIFHIDTEEPIFKKYQVSFVPTQVLLDASGREVFRHLGLFQKKDLVRKLKELQFIKE